MEEPRPVLYNLNHNHPLMLVFFQNNEMTAMLPRRKCSACKEDLSGFWYKCSFGCTFALHIECALLSEGIREPPTQVVHLSHHHRHPMEYSFLGHRGQVVDAAAAPVCYGCNRPLSGDIYTCGPCDISFHLECLFLQVQVSYDVDNHSLSLLSHGANQTGHFICIACARRDTGYSYNCRICDVQFHVLCAKLPLFLRHQMHTHLRHQMHTQLLMLVKIPSTFKCDICGNMSEDSQWSYLCTEPACLFKAHFRCATGLSHFY